LAHPRDGKNSIDVFQVATDAIRNINLLSLSKRTSMIQDDEAMSVFTHSGPIGAYRDHPLRVKRPLEWGAAEAEKQNLFAGTASPFYGIDVRFFASEVC
jgi:hypothetical protein